MRPIITKPVMVCGHMYGLKIHGYIWGLAMETEKSLTAANMFAMIKEYHEILGYPIAKEDQNSTVRSATDRRDMNNQLIAALHNEVTELQESTPWKPWRPLGYKSYNMDNMAEEVVDILFFLGAFMENNSLSWEQVEDVFKRKMHINYERIKLGYSKTR